MKTQMVILFIVLTLITTLGFVSLIRNIIYANRFSQDKEDVKYFEKHLNHTKGVAILFFLLFLGWLFSAGIIVGKYLINSVFNH